MLESPSVNRATGQKMNGSTECSESNHVSTSVYCKIQPKASSIEVTKETETELISLLKGKLAESSAELSNGVRDDETETCNADVKESTISSDAQLSESNNNVLNAVAVSGLNNLVVVSSLPNVATKNEIIKNPKLLVLNGTVLKEGNDAEKGKNDNINIICLTNNVNNIIKKINYDAVVKPNLKIENTSDKDAEKLENVPTTMPTFIQLSQSNLKNLSSKITLNVSPSTVTSSSTTTKSVNNSYEILRSKLENSSPQFTTDDNSAARKTVERNRKIFKKDQSEDSPAVALARNELIESRRTLIQIAMKKHMPMYKPPASYTGPTYTCEECFDTFSSEESVANHKDRRSVLFTYSCPDCDKTLEFYNRCTFSMHIRSHNANIKANSLTVSTIPADKLNFKLRDDDDLLVERNDTIFSECATKSVVSTNCASSTAFSAKRNVCQSAKKKKLSPRNINPDTNKEYKSSKAMPSPLRDDRKSSSEDTGAKTVARAKLSQSSSTPSSSQINKSKKKNSLNSIMKVRKENSMVLPKTKSKIGNSALKAITDLNKSSQTVAVTPNAPKTEDILLTSSDDEVESFKESSNSANFVECRECKKEVQNLTRHFRGSNRPLKEYPCDKCDFFNPSECALKAHIRMLHTRSQPFVCPDCGFFFNKLETFLMHVKMVCFYHYKTIRFKCPECSVLKPSVALFDDHLRHCHVRDVFKCSSCITSSYSMKVVQDHMEKVHSGTSVHVLEGYRCMLCPNLLIAKQLIQVHVKKHVYGLQHLRYVYICNHCKKFASGKKSKFENHYNACPSRKESSPSPESLSLTTPRPSNSIKKPAPTRVRKSPEKVALVSKEKDPLFVEEGETDRLKAEYGPKTKVCVMCRTTKLSDQWKSLFCKTCVSVVDSEETTEGAVGNENAPATDVGRSKRKFKCKLCKRFMNRDWSTITSHYEQDHHADFDVAPKSKGGGDSNGQRKRKPSLKNESTIAAKTVKMEPKYSCVKCGMSTSVRIDFHAHITSHKTQSNTDFQCLECGECFIVKPSLEKHLVVVHKIRDLKEYYKENKVEDEDEIKQEMLAENQCEVCYMECGSKQNYDKHIRTHGMAFVAMQSRVKS